MSEAHPERSEQKLRFFKDPECTNPLFIIAFDEPITVGETGEKVVFVKNITNEELVDLEIESPDPRVKFVLGTNKLDPKISTTVKILATPDTLKAITIKPIVRGRAIARGMTTIEY